ncbi:hypothetical protein J2X69_000351 [Algoriphagus sp. 4150]|nr:hypothetical protein [Algoriphagus sp. 4150]
MSVKSKYSCSLLLILLIFLVLKWYYPATIVSCLLLLGIGIKRIRDFQIQLFHKILYYLSIVKTYILLLIIYFLVLVPTSFVFKARNWIRRQKNDPSGSLNYFSPQEKSLRDFEELW